MGRKEMSAFGDLLINEGTKECLILLEHFFTPVIFNVYPLPFLDKTFKFHNYESASMRQEV